MRDWGNFSYRLLPFNPGFSLLIVNPTEPSGFIVFEAHGFSDENVTDRMHVLIRRRDSPRWFTYWVERYEAMWRSAVEGKAADTTSPPAK
jgi:hypothetical protein